MPNGDGTGPDGKGPKTTNKGWPERTGRGKRQGRGRGLRRRDGSCQRDNQDTSNE